jgi:hypothetical protein
MKATTENLTAYMLGKLDTIIDRQAELKLLLSQRPTSTEAPRPAAATRATKQFFSRMRNISPFWQSMAAGGLFWIIGICTRSYLSRGGDPMALIELLLKSVL